MFRFFIEHPRFSLVISLFILISGILGLSRLPIEKFPDLSPPVVDISTQYPGASAEVVEQTVTAILEREINGVPGMISIDSISSNDGACRIKVSFEIGSDVELKSVLVQNRVQKAESQLPPEVRREGVTVKAASTNMLAIVNLMAEDEERYDELFLNNYALLNVKESITRTPGIGQVQVLGSREYGMRIWLDPDRLRAFGIAPQEVANAIVAQNAQLAGGRVGAAPTVPEQQFQFSVVTPGRLASKAEFEAIRIRTRADGSTVRLRDVAEIELGAQNYDVSSRVNGRPAASLVAYQLPGSNALAAVRALEAEMERLSASFPEGVTWKITYDSTRVVEASVDEMITTLYIAVGLVILVVFVFLGGIRPTIIPAVAVPVSLIGTFALMAGLGFSLNILTLFGLILAIGIVVDDAILVVETTTRNIEEQGMLPKEAAIAAMKEVGGAVIASTLVLLAVFVPVAFIPGLSGRLFLQFALTISSAVVISTINALTLSPALCSLVLAKPGTEPTALAKAFDRVFKPVRNAYVGLVRTTLVRKALAPLVLILVCAATGVLAKVTPSGFVPIEDDGVLFAQVALPDAASTNRTEAAAAAVVAAAQEEEGVSDVISFTGFDLLTGAVTPNKATVFVIFDDWKERTDPERSVAAVKARIDGKLWKQTEATAFSFQPPPISGLGLTAGVDFQLQDRGGLGAAILTEVAHDLAATAQNQPAIGRAISQFSANVPRIRIDLDREQAARIGVPLSNIQDTLASSLAPRYVDDLVLFGRTFRVMMSGQQGRVREPEQILELTTQTTKGELVPLGSIADVRLEPGPSFVSRFNLYPNATITVVPAPGYSSGDAILAMEQVAGASLGPEFGYEWSGQAREQKEAAGSTTVVFVLSLVFVFLFLTAQYESFSTPVAVILMVPMAVFGAFLGQLVAGLSIDLYTQVGLVLLVGLTAKTAILLVELSKQFVEAGKTPNEAVTVAARTRFRAVVMTAGTFILGMLPLLTASGAGANSRVSLGTAVASGTLAGIVFTLALVPRLYVLIQTLVTRRK